VRGSLGHTLKVGQVGPGGEYAGVHVGAKLRTKHRGEYYVGVSAGRKIATPRYRRIRSLRSRLLAFDRRKPA
jgi:hypothetical protein